MSRKQRVWDFILDYALANIDEMNEYLVEAEINEFDVTQADIEEMRRKFLSPKPAECFHPAEFLREELQVRQWDKAHFLVRCSWYGDPMDVERIGDVHDGLIDVIDERLSKVLGHVFGVSSRLFLNLSATYCEWLRSK